MTVSREFKGDCMGVRLVQRGPDDKHICFQLLVEGRGSGSYSSSYWLDELIEVLQNARASMKHHSPDKVNGRQYGWRFK